MPIKTIFILLFILFPLGCFADSLKSIQNKTIYNLILSQPMVLKDSMCVPSCATTLLPGATQAYQFTGTAGSITFDYDVKDVQQLKIGHLTIVATPTRVNLTNGLGGVIAKSVTTAQISYTQPIPLWKGTFSDLKNWKTNNWLVSKSLPRWGDMNIEVISGTITPAPSKTNYVRVNFPAGSANSAASPPLPLGGTQFYGAVVTSTTPITLSYFIRFPTTFPFVNPPGSTRPYTLGKLPGLYGGKGNTGSDLPMGFDGWSIRFMWCDYAQETNKKVQAGGEIAQFTVDSNKGLYGTPKGKFIGCGTWKFAADSLWHNIQQTIHLNEIGKANGRVDVCYDGKLVYSQSNIEFRKTVSLGINGILFQSFFGGSGPDYATPSKTYIDFADFALFRYPVASPPGLCVSNP